MTPTSRKTSRSDNCIELALALAKLYDEGYPSIPHSHEGDNGEIA